jgi:membrane protease YdiL (CAAX protease family)
MSFIAEAVIVGMFVMLAGTIPRNIIFAANLHVLPSVPWAVPVTGVYLWFFWHYLNGDGPPTSTREYRRTRLRAKAVSGRVLAWALLAGGLGIVALVLALRVASRMVALPEQRLPELSKIPGFTVWSLLLMAAAVAALVEEAAFRGYMQGPLERRYGVVPAILITGTMFAIAHLDFTPVLWPYYAAVAAIYGIVTSLTNSIWPAIVLHTAGNTYSNIDLLLHGRAEWQASSGAAQSIWTTGIDAAFVRLSVAVFVTAGATAWAYVKLARVAGDATDSLGSPSSVARSTGME